MSDWIKIVFLIWLPWILRMHRPPGSNGCEYGQQPSRPASVAADRKPLHFQDVELKERSSKSLLANVLDIDDDFRHNHRGGGTPTPLPTATFFRTVYRQNEDNGNGGRLHESLVSNHSCLSADYELALILKEIRFITDQLRKEDEAADITRDWKFAAMVVDRLCLIIFTLFTIIATLAVLFSAPHIIVS